MTTQIVTKDLGDGLYEHHMNISTYYYYQSIVSPVSLRESRVGKMKNAPLKSSFGKFQPYRLSQYVSLDDVRAYKGQIVKLASVDKGKLNVNPEAVKIFDRYPDNEIAFVGNYGRQNSGKSFLFDKILNLSDFEGNNYSQTRRQPGLYFWSIPYTKDNLKFFLLDYAGFEGKDDINPDQQKLLDFQLLLSEKFLIVPAPNDEELTVLRPAYNHLLQSQRRFSDKGIQANKFSPYWPNEIYTLYRSPKPVKKEIDNIGVLFNIYNFSILHDALDPAAAGKKEELLKSSFTNNPEVLNEKYVKMSSYLFKDIYDKMKGKQHEGITVNGKNLAHIVKKSTQSINNSGQVKIDKIFEGAKGTIYDETVDKCKKLYLQEVEPIARTRQAKPLDVLTDAFSRGSAKAYRQFDKDIIDYRVHEQYEAKLQRQIDEIEKKILEDNKNKTYAFYDSVLPKKDADEWGEGQEELNRLNKSFSDSKSKTKLDHDDHKAVKQRLQSLALGQSQQILLLPKAEKQKAIQLKKLLKNKKKQYEGIVLQKSGQLKGVYSAGNDKNTIEKHEVLISKAQDLKKELNTVKQELNPLQKEILLTTLRENHKNNEQLLNQLKTDPPKSQQIDQLKEKIKKITVKNSQIEGGINNLDKTYLSNRSNISNKSVIRQIPKSQNIKKVSLK